MIDKLLPRVPPMGRRFYVGVALGLVPTLALCYSLLAYQWRAFHKADEATYRFESLRATLIAMEKVSAERKPMNSALGSDSPLSSARAVPLKRARMDSDEWINRLLNSLRPNKCDSCADDYARVKQLKDNLATSRTDADRLISLPRRKRGDEMVSSMVTRFFDLVDEFNPLVVSQTMGVVKGDSNVLNCVIIARLATNLREQAGRLGSHLTAALANERALTLDERLVMEYTRGHINQLHALLEASMVEHPTLAPQAFAAMNARYFNEGQHYVRSVEVLGSPPGGAQLSTDEFMQTYVPYMRPIVAFRDTMLQKAEDELRGKRQALLITLALTAAAEALLLSAFVWIIASFRRDVLRPFAQATHSIRAIAAGDLTQEVPVSFVRREIRDLFDAIRVLKSNSVERTRLEAERARLIDELATMAEADPLTRLLNRRAFETRARGMCAQHDADGSLIALIMIDIDHFKHINDTFGHAVGDEALRLVARLARRHLPEPQIVARIGGEEFAIMIRAQHPSMPLQVAEALREDIAEATITDHSGSDCRITASFGIALAETGSAELATLLREAGRLLYEAKLAGRNCVLTSGRPTVPAEEKNDA